MDQSKKKVAEEELESKTQEKASSKQASNTTSAPSISEQNKAISSSPKVAVSAPVAKDDKEEYKAKPSIPKAKDLGIKPPILSLKGILSNKEDKEQKDQELVESDSVDDALKQLTEEKLHEVWGLLCVNFLSQSSFHSTLKSNLPTLKEGIIYFNVSNQVQFNDFKDHKQSIYDFLRAKLSVQNIRIEVKVNKIASSNVAAYTDRDKYDIMLKHNPKLGELKAQFGLEPDF